MAEDLNILKGTKTEQYESLVPQIQGLLEGETNLTYCRCFKRAI